jgi:histone deacetylase 1/2
MKTPVELLFHEPPDYTFLKVFGCACWPHLRPYNSRKLEFRSKQCVFLGYSSMHKGYKCLHIPSNRVYISRDVVFDENLFPFAPTVSPPPSLLPPSPWCLLLSCLVNLMMLHILLFCFLTMVQVLDEVRALSF